MSILKNVFIGLSKNTLLNKIARKYGLKLGAQHVVAGTNITETIETVKRLNTQGISCTIDNLGEFVNSEEQALSAKHQILSMIEMIQEEQADAHISLKPSQLGLDISHDFCEQNIKDIVHKANEYGIFINVDMEDYERLQPSFDIVEKLAEHYSNVGTVIQAYFFRAEEDLHRLKNQRLRIVKGAYKESSAHAYTDKADIDENYIKLIKWHLINGKFTSVATHDHHIIDEVKRFVTEYNIPVEKFEFQMLYGFRVNLQEQLVQEGYSQCTYVPFGDDWYGYFMRRLAERPQNIFLVTRQLFTKKAKVLIALLTVTLIIARRFKK